jgi:hypothetical protein
MLTQNADKLTKADSSQPLLHQHGHRFSRMAACEAYRSPSVLMPIAKAVR